MIESTLHLLRVVDIPLFQYDHQVGYLPQAEQHGSHLWRSDFHYNDRHMARAERFDASKAGGDILLIGDSLVFGGIAYAESERLGMRLEAVSARRVWPVGAGSWSLHNELAYLERFPEAATAVGSIIFLLNSGDMTAGSSWSSETTHPRQRPFPASLYLAAQFIGPTAAPVAAAPSPGLGIDPTLPARFAALAAATAADVCVVLYPNRTELATKDGSSLRAIEAALAGAVPRPIRFVHLADDPAWSLDAYKDGIHPSAAGNGRLAARIAEGCRSRRPAAA